MRGVGACLCNRRNGVRSNRRQGGGGWHATRMICGGISQRQRSSLSGGLRRKKRRAYWIEARWAGEPACARCGSKRVWAERGGRFECADCSDEPDVRARSCEERPRSRSRSGSGSVRDLLPAQRHLGQGAAADLGLRLVQDSVELAAQAPSGAGPSDREPLGPFVQIDETLVGGKGSPTRSWFWWPHEADGRVRLAHAENDDEGTLKSFAEGRSARSRWTPRS